MSTRSWIPSIIKENLPLHNLTTLKVGGIARYGAFVESEEQLLQVLRFAKEAHVSPIFLGKGSNLLVGDGLIDACVILNRLQGIVFQDNRVMVGAGVNVSYLAQHVSKLGWGGLEFLSGIPGSVGGVVVMNAGAHKCETKDVVVEVVTLDLEGNRNCYSAQGCDFRYRGSRFRDGKEVVVSVTFQLQEDLTAEAKRKQILTQRLATQPYKAATAGCMFKNPNGTSAGALIDACGLKGVQIGGSKVSEKHANFFENVGNATAENVLELVNFVCYQVKERMGISLELEVIPCFTTYTPTQPLPMDS